MVQPADEITTIGLEHSSDTYKAAPQSVSRRSLRAMGRLARRIAHEPFLHFVILGAALYALSHYLEERARFQSITITKDQVRRIDEGYRLQYGTAPSPTQLDALVGRFIEEEILYREALKVGLDREDEIIRRRLVQKYEFLQQDLSIPAEPTEAQLRDYYQKHLYRYGVPERVTFTQVYFSPERWGEQGARAAAEALSSSLNLRGATRAIDEGDRFPGASDYAALSQEELARVFGQEGLSEAIFRVEPNRWSAPLRSGFGWHIVYVSARQPGRQQAFAEVREHIRRDYIETERARRNAAALAKLRKHFEIVRE